MRRMAAVGPSTIRFAATTRFRSSGPSPLLARVASARLRRHPRSLARSCPGGQVGHRSVHSDLVQEGHLGEEQIDIDRLLEAKARSSTAEEPRTDLTGTPM